MHHAVGHMTITTGIDESIPVSLRECTVGIHAEHVHFHAPARDLNYADEGTACRLVKPRWTMS